MSKNIEFNVDKLKIEHLVLSGGGLLGISYVGVLKFLEENNIVKNIKSITGCSAGSLLGALFALGYNSAELEHILQNLNFKEYLNITADSILNIDKKKGLDSGHKIDEFIKNLIFNKTHDQHITFFELKNKFNIILQIGITNLTLGQYEIINYKNSPNLPIHIAIKASISIPLIFEPILINENIYCDGGIIDNFPIYHSIQIAKELQNNISDKNNISNKNNIIDKEKDNIQKKENITENKKNKKQNIIDTIFAICLTNKFKQINSSNYEEATLAEYLNILTHAFSKGSIIKKQKYNKFILQIEIPCDIMTFIKINATSSDVENIIQIAYDTCCQHFT